MGPKVGVDVVEKRKIFAMSDPRGKKQQEDESIVQ
jgi:hypothetical protein